jgi:hypothetical protein
MSAGDDEIDALVARAAARPVDVGALQAQVLARVRTGGDEGLFGWLRGPGLLLPAGFAAVLAVTPAAVARLPGPGIDQLVAAVAIGDPLLFGPGDLE